MTNNDSTPPNLPPTRITDLSGLEAAPKAPSMGYNGEKPLDIKKNEIEVTLEGTQTAKRKLFFVYSKYHNQVLHDPMTGQPVHARFPKLLREVAKQFNGQIVDGEEAIRLITRNNKNDSKTN